MSSNDKVFIEVEMLDRNKSLDNLDNGGKRLNKTLERTKELMAGTKGGSKAANAAYGQTEYNTARGTIGTGAGGRDFAKQSRELDGLVRLYAVYAANIFAAEAAFRALSEAMNTTNMIEGLNQLGAASGVAMGGLAKRFAEASGGAVSLRESMEATAKAVSSGLTQSQFLKLGEVAKKASQALGLNMTDAVSRLTRGITKLEPELLDELGIFTKVGQATEDYARAIGKPVSALTDFEKRQAFANAVLTEGAKKFGEINIPTNAYDKLLATLKNVAQAGLDLVNNVLAPFATLLANNTGLLVGALGLIGMKLVKDALPAIGQWRDGLKLAAEEAKKRSADISASFGEAFVERTNAAFKVPELERNLKQSEEAYRASRAKMAAMDTDLSKRVLKGGVSLDDKSLKNEQARYTREINKLKAEGLAADNAQIVALEKQREAVKKLRDDRIALTVAQNAALEKSEGGGGSLLERAGDYLRSNAAKDARARSQRLNIISDVSTNQREKGFGAAMGTMWQDLKTLPSWLDKLRAGFGGLIVGVGGAVGTIVSGLSRILGPIGVVIAVLQTVLPFFRKNEEQAARFSASLDLLKENSENAYRVLERISKLDPLEKISLDVLAAKANAIEGIATTLTTAFTDFNEEVKNRGNADMALNWMASLVGASSEQQFAKKATTAIERALTLAAGTAQANLQGDLATLLKIPVDASFKAIAEAYANAEPEVKAAANKLMESAGKEAVRQTGSFKTFKESLTQSGKVYQDLMNTFKNSTPLGKFAEDSTAKILELGNLLGDSKMGLTEKVSSLAEMSGRMDFLQLFPPQAAAGILAASNQLNDYKKELSEIEPIEEAITAAIGRETDARQQELAKLGNNPTLIAASDNLKKIDQTLAALRSRGGQLDKDKQRISEGFDKAAGNFYSAMRDGLIANIKTFSEGLRMAAAKSVIELKQGALEGVVDPSLKNKISADLDRQTIELERKKLLSQKSLIDSNIDLKIAVMENTLAIGLAKSGVMKPGETREQALARPENAEYLAQSTAIETVRKNRDKGSADILKQLEKEKKENPQARIAGGTAEGLSIALTNAQARESLAAEIQNLKGKTAGVNLKERFGEADAARVKGLELIRELQKDVELEQQKFTLEQGSMSEAQFKEESQQFVARKAYLDYDSKVMEAQSVLRKAKIADEILNSNLSKENVDYAQNQLQTVIRQAGLTRDIAIGEGDRATSVAQLVELQTQLNDKNEQSRSMTMLTLDADIAKNKTAQDKLTLQSQLGMIDSASLKIAMDELKVEEAKLDQKRQLTAAQAAYNQEVEKLDLARAQAGGTLTGQKLADYEKAKKDAAERRDATLANIKTVTNAQIESAEIIQSANDRQLAYTQQFKQAFKGMEDAIVNFVKTGKLSFKDMINSFLEGLLRFEIQQQQMALFKGFGNESGLATTFMQFLGFSTPTTGKAKGGVYDAGLETFAKGGMFTNSIVSQPTLFKFARGTGLMGEAGPEAIMPLKRDSNGNLGVRSNQGKVDVVVNNYSNQQATTKETTDSRGNRRIEVIVGDMVASELNRVGSSTQQAMTASYGTAPLLARR